MAELFAGKEWQTFLQILPTIPLSLIHISEPTRH